MQIQYCSLDVSKYNVELCHLQGRRNKSFGPVECPGVKNSLIKIDLILYSIITLMK